MKQHLTVLLALFATAANAEGVQVFGFELGKPLSLPECPYKTFGSSPKKMYEILVQETCYWDTEKDRRSGIPVKRIVFSQKESPAIVKNWQIEAIESNDILVGFEFLTAGIESQDLVLSQLTQKFGKPESLTKRSVQTKFGATFGAVDASWKYGDVSVSFNGTTDRIDFGRVTIDLPVATEVRRQSTQDQRKSERQL